MDVQPGNNKRDQRQHQQQHDGGSTSPGRFSEHTFLGTLQHRVLIGDGGIGTQLYAGGASESEPFEGLNVTDQAAVQQVHLDYLNAGAEVIQTNTFGANRFRLESHGLGEKVWDLNVWGVKVARNAREIAGEPAFVAGSVGPLGKPLAPLGPIQPRQARDAFKEQLEGLLAGGVDLFIFETMADPREVEQAFAALRELCRLPVVIQFSFTSEGEGTYGETPARVGEALAQLPDVQPDVLGINCGAGPAPILQFLQTMAAACPSGIPLSVYPNAGLPRRVGGRYLYQSMPDYMAQFVEPFVAAGARLIGGCCGTTPEHVAALRRARDELVPREGAGAALSQEPAAGGTANSGNGHPVLTTKATPQPRLEVVGGKAAPSSEGQQDDLAETGAVPPPIHDGGFRKKIQAGRFVVSVELDPPRGVIGKKFLRGAQMLRDAGVDALNVADSPMARVRMSHIAGAQLVIRHTGIEPIIHFTTRDRNLMGIQSDLLGAHALGIRHILSLTGDPPSIGKYAHASAVYDVDSIGLLKILNELNRGNDVAGNPIGRPTDFTLACALTPVPEDFDLEVKRFREKLAQNPHFVMTQPLYDLEPLARMLHEVGGCPIPLLLGVMPLHSSKHAEYLHHEVPGISIPEHVRTALRKAGDEGLRVGMEKAGELVEAARTMVSGIYVVPSFGKYEPVADFVQELRRRDNTTQRTAIKE